MEYKIKKIQNVSEKCMICGINNSAGLKARFFEIDYEERPSLLAVPKVEWYHQSYPGRMHGGIIGALLDETIGRAVQISDTSLWGVTGELTVRYLVPVPLGGIYVIGFLTKENRMLFEGGGKIISAADGKVLATATGKYVKLTVEQICDGGDEFLHKEWFADPRPALDVIELP